MLGLGTASSLVGALGGNNAVKKIGGAISNFGSKISDNAGIPNSALGGVGSFISKTGGKISQKTPSNIGRNLRQHGMNNIRGSMNNIMPQRSMYRNRYRER